jgi:2,4-dienoyl-CoA reductase-like NADH-dependent reductase (Old Yellow Enzyme family)
MEQLFTPFTLGSLSLKNRFLRAGCFEGMAHDGCVTPQLIQHHKDLAEGGIAMTTVGYCAVSQDGRGFGNELWMHDDIISDLKHLTKTVHESGARVSIQLVHCGYFSSPKVIGSKPVGASKKFCAFRMSFCTEMTERQIEQKRDDFANAALAAKDAGFDAVELHAGHGYLLSQFLSPYTNRRTDKYGGNIENRLRFPTDVIRKIREAAGEDFPILVKMNQTDGFKGGIEIADALKIARSFEEAGAAAIIPSCGFTAKTPFMMLRGDLPIKEMSSNQQSFFMKAGLTVFGKLMVQHYEFSPMFLLEGAKQIAKEVKIPVVYIGGVTGIESAQQALEGGCKLVQVGRATIRDTDFVKNLQSGKITVSDCDHCNRCVATMDAGGVSCVSE